MKEDKKVDSDINFGNTKFVSVKSNLIVEMNDKFVLYTDDGGCELDVKITADLESVPEKYREVFLNILTSKYLNKVSFSDNPFSVCKEQKRIKWYEFWKPKYFLSLL
jgi:hypothetical protein